MKTPFDGAIRLQRREIDEMRVAINVQVERLVTIETAQVDTDAVMRRERDIAGEELLLSSHAYMARMHAERRRLAEDRAVVDIQLTQLRTRATAAYGMSKAIEDAARNYCEEQLQAEATAEQARLDDQAATRFLRLTDRR
ncbi:hypothetical protein [Sphingomonas oligoaromativorans]|uniref:hypothetical protein n=1 Tax=Sphingomonas oligoaromativorans TaxID=575322 RepID=UPI0014200B4F|nr:hypothetical protein [Sphingomonas oligoaromativorans]NIJ34739.1 hypothetical protein [Sphingomonas oligoaromativorans]